MYPLRSRRSCHRPLWWSSASPQLPRMNVTPTKYHPKTTQVRWVHDPSFFLFHQILFGFYSFWTKTKPQLHKVPPSCISVHQICGRSEDSNYGFGSKPGAFRDDRTWIFLGHTGVSQCGTTQSYTDPIHLLTQHLDLMKHFKLNFKRKASQSPLKSSRLLAAWRSCPSDYSSSSLSPERPSAEPLRSTSQATPIHWHGRRATTLLLVTLAGVKSLNIQARLPALMVGIHSDLQKTSLLVRPSFPNPSLQTEKVKNLSNPKRVVINEDEL